MARRPYFRVPGTEYSERRTHDEPSECAHREDRCRCNGRAVFGLVSLIGRLKDLSGPAQFSRLLPAIEHWPEIRERRMGRDAASGSIATIAGRFQSPLVFIVMAIQTQQLPVAAIGRVVVVIVVPVMNGQLTKVSVCEFAGAAPTDPRIDLERLLSVALLALGSGTAGLGHYAVQFARVFRFHAAILFLGS